MTQSLRERERREEGREAINAEQTFIGRARQVTVLLDVHPSALLGSDRSRLELRLEDMLLIGEDDASSLLSIELHD